MKYLALMRRKYLNIWWPVLVLDKNKYKVIEMKERLYDKSKKIRTNHVLEW